MALAAAVVHLTPPVFAADGFVPGHVFVSEPAPEACWTSASDRIWEFDPVCGEFSLFVEIPEEDCGTMMGIVFTPDGARLRAAMFGTSKILEFDADGNYTIVLDGSDGIFGPFGSNGIAYDKEGNFYSLMFGGSGVIRFPPDGGHGAFLANFSPYFADSMAVTSDGIVYTGGGFGGPSKILVVLPDGDISLVDQYSFVNYPNALAVDTGGRLYVGLTQGTLLTYDIGDPDSQTTLVDDSNLFCCDYPIVLRPDEKKLYLPGTWDDILYLIDVIDGTIEAIGDYPGYGSTDSRGIAVVPHPKGDADFDTDVDAEDYPVIHGCLTGPGDFAPLGDCRFADLDKDDDVDLADIGVFQTAFTGPTPPPPSNCCDTDHGAGCNEPVVEACVCEHVPACCDFDWDE